MLKDIEVPMCRYSYLFIIIYVCGRKLLLPHLSPEINFCVCDFVPFKILLLFILTRFHLFKKVDPSGKGGKEKNRVWFVLHVLPTAKSILVHRK